MPSIGSLPPTNCPEDPEIKGPGPDRGMVFQSPCLLPWLTALENVMLGVDQVYYTASRTERRDLAEYYLSLVGLADAMHKRPAELSQGMRQRVGIARAFALSPKMLLLDEPFGMLDSLTRFELQKVLLDLWGRDQRTDFMVTHDVDEAIYLADRVVMMTNGPDAEVGDILDVHFPRPRDRKEIMEHPDYYRLREYLIIFLEERAEKKRGIAADMPPHVDERIVDLGLTQYKGREGSKPMGASLRGDPKRAGRSR